jgi:hypothetical protein
MRPVSTNDIQFQSSVRALCFETSEADFLIHLIFFYFSIYRLMIYCPESPYRKTLVLYDFLTRWRILELREPEQVRLTSHYRIYNGLYWS